MARIHLTLLSVLLYCVTYIYAAATVNSIAGPVAQGATVYVTYSFSSPPPGKVTLQVINLTTKDTKSLSDNLPITPASFKWVVDVAVGTYYLALNDGSGQVFSGNFDVSAGTLPPSTTPAAPAASTPAPAAPPASTPAAPAASATTPAASAASSSPASSSTASPAAESAKPSAANSAPSFSGYSLLISLAVVAAVMFHMA